MSIKARPHHTDRKSSYDFAAMSVTEIAKLIRHGVVSPVEVVKWFIDRAEDHNPAINAIVARRFEDAIEEATRLEMRIKRGWDNGPLAGVPFTVKEMISVDGMPITAGSTHREGVRSNRDAEVVQRLRGADAIPIGVTNTSEMGLTYESSNPVYGPTKNPYGHTHTAGGSSGGEGAAVGAAMTGFGVGSDMGGSLRIPSFYCNLYGHKPTAGQVPIGGHFPLDYSTQRMQEPPGTTYVAIGPMTRHARDLRPLVDIMAGRAPRFELPIGDLSGIRVFVLDEPDFKRASAPDSAVKAGIYEIARVLGEAGASITPYQGPSFADALDIYTHVLAQGNEIGLQAVMGTGKRPSLFRELPRLVLGKSEYTAAALMPVFGDKALQPKPENIERFAQLRLKLQHDLETYLGPQGVLLLPTLPTAAPLHGETLKHPFDLAYTGIFSVLETPVTQVPAGYDPEGMPVGVQLVGVRGADDLTMRVAEAIEEKRGGWKPPALHI